MNLSKCLFILLVAAAITPAFWAQESQPRLLPPHGVMLLLEPEMACRHHLRKVSQPKYPESARQAQIEGEVLVFIWFDKTGNLFEAKILRSPDQSLSDAVLTAVRELHLTPYAPLYPDANFMSELRFEFSLTNGKAEVSNASEEEQMKQSTEFNEEIELRRKKSTP